MNLCCLENPDNGTGECMKRQVFRRGLTLAPSDGPQGSLMLCGSWNKAPELSATVNCIAFNPTA